MFEGAKILYLEDEVLIALDTSEHLEDLGFETVCMAHRLDQARDAAEHIDFDFALFDINVDRGQTSVGLGDELCQKGVAVIYASGSSGKAEELRSKGCRFLDKPLSLEALTDALREVHEEKQTA